VGEEARKNEIGAQQQSRDQKKSRERQRKSTQGKGNRDQKGAQATIQGVRSGGAPQKYQLQQVSEQIGKTWKKEKS